MGKQKRPPEENHIWVDDELADELAEKDLNKRRDDPVDDVRRAEEKIRVTKLRNSKAAQTHSESAHETIMEAALRGANDLKPMVSCSSVVFPGVWKNR